jgi:transposase
MLDLPGASVQTVDFTNDGIVVSVRLRKKRAQCRCGRWSRSTYDRSRRRWRHLDLAASKCWIESDIRRIDCKACGKVVTEQIPWARPAARHTRDFEDVIGWLCQRTDRTAVTRLMRVSWEGVTSIVNRVVADHLNSERLDSLYRIGVDEISYKKRHYLTVISDHDTSSVVHIAPGRTSNSLNEFFELLGPQRCKQIKAITMDMAPMWQPPCATHIPDAVTCFDPFHVMTWVNRALDAVYRAHRNPYTNNRKWQRARTSLRTAAENLTPDRTELIADLAGIHRDIGHAWTLKEDFRALYKDIDPIHAHDYLRDWITRAQHSNITQFMNLARRINKHFNGILAAIEHQLANALAENINARIRLINKRGYGHHSPQTLTTMIYLCLGGITINLPTQT